MNDDGTYGMIPNGLTDQSWTTWSGAITGTVGPIIIDTESGYASEYGRIGPNGMSEVIEGLETSDYCSREEYCPSHGDGRLPLRCSSCRYGRKVDFPLISDRAESARKLREL